MKMVSNWIDENIDELYENRTKQGLIDLVLIDPYKPDSEKTKSSFRNSLTPRD